MESSSPHAVSSDMMVALARLERKQDEMKGMLEKVMQDTKMVMEMVHRMSNRSTTTGEDGNVFAAPKMTFSSSSSVMANAEVVGPPSIPGIINNNKHEEDVEISKDMDDGEGSQQQQQRKKKQKTMMDPPPILENDEYQNVKRPQRDILKKYNENIKLVQLRMDGVNHFIRKRDDWAPQKDAQGGLHRTRLRKRCVICERKVSTFCVKCEAYLCTDVQPVGSSQTCFEFFHTSKTLNKKPCS